ncbi:RHS repeat-associated core domain-containing protein [Bdellovibrio sp. 22V]|uniref:RHS repeat domain-containing protein n=1 Tax=Bdellovibrio sp. 22V TaxID=3044166 RepID=UPI0025427E8A|nr:RHS repeat-associated core domain-containing protein [Bdellovibrio sp. 22V]WII71411.1 RHS repeat-associated core domain-containing protein [Bdellovibrio sp. 22V]
MRLIFLNTSIFCFLFGYSSFSRSQTCEEGRADTIKAFSEGCTSQCWTAPGWQSCATYEPMQITHVDSSTDRLSCKVKYVEDSWDIVNDPPYPPYHNEWEDEHILLVPRCFMVPPAEPINPPPGGPGGPGGPPGGCPVSGSIVHIESQSLSEEIRITGVKEPLVYNSVFQPGREDDFRIKVKISGDTPRDYIQSFSIETKRDGVVVDTASFSNTTPNQTYQYVWNGLDASNTFPVLSAKFQVRMVETSPAGSFPNIFNVSLGHFNARDIGLGGWLPKNFRLYDPFLKRIYFAEGGFKDVEAKPYSVSQLYIASAAGNEVYIFDLNGRHLYTKTALLGTNIYSFNYDSQGRLISIAEPFGKVTTFNRDSSGNFNSIQAPSGQLTLVGLDSNGYISSIKNPRNEIYSMSYYSSGGLLHTFQKPNGEISTFEYDLGGKLTKDSHSGGYFFELIKNINSSYAFDISMNTALGRMSQIQTSSLQDGSISRNVNNSMGTATSVSYTPQGPNHSLNETSYGVTRAVTSIEDARFGGMVRFPQSESVSKGGGTRTIDRTQSVMLANMNDPFSITSWQETSQLSGENTKITTVFDPLTKKFTATSFLGKVKEWAIDSYERIVSAKQGNLNAVNFIYTNENLTSIVNGTRTTTLGYNALGLLESITNPLNQTTSYVYDTANRVASKVLPDSRVISFIYDGVGNLTGVTPPGRPLHAFSLNGHGLVGAYEPPVLSGVSLVNTTYTYNLDKQLTAIARPDGGFVNYNFNATTGVLENYETPDGFYYQYLDTTVGLPSSVETPFGVSTQITYIGREPAGYNTYISGNSVGSYSSIYGAGNRKDSDTVMNPIGTTSTVTYLYNDDEDLKKAGDVNLTYNVPDGQLTGTTMGTGTTGFSDTYTYNTYGEIVGYQAKRGTTVIYDLTLNRDAMGRIDGKTQTMNGATDNYVYTFDNSGRLSQTDKNSAVAATYTYDTNSNRNGGTIGAQPTSATYDDQDRLLTYNTYSFTYNANGDLVSKLNNTTSALTQYVYDVFGNLTQVTLPNGTVISYEIDGLNRRIGKKVNGVVQKRWIYMDQYRIAAELNAAGAITKRFIYGSKANIPDYMIASGVKYRIISDHLGSPRLVVKQSDGAVIQRMDHDEFGRVIVDTNPGYLPFGFAGGVYDNQTSLVRFGARDFDPEIGRWTLKDPILFKGQMVNLYSYVFNDPVNYFDQNGRLPWLVSGAVGGIIGAVAGGIGAYATNQSILAGIAMGGVTGFAAGSGGALLLKAAAIMEVGLGGQILSSAFGAGQAAFTSNILSQHFFNNKVDVKAAAVSAGLCAIGGAGGPALGSGLSGGGAAAVDIGLGIATQPLDILSTILMSK